MFNFLSNGFVLSLKFQFFYIGLCGFNGVVLQLLLDKLSLIIVPEKCCSLGYSLVAF